MDGLKQHWRNEGSSLQVVRNPELPDHMKNVREIIALFTEPQQRNQGYASALMEDVCAEADICQIVLLLKPEQYGRTGGVKDLQAFYRKFGFIKIQDKPVLMARSPIFNPVKKIIAESISG